MQDLLLPSDDSDEDDDPNIDPDCLQDLPKKALYVLKVILECKALVKYVKKVSSSLLYFAYPEKSLFKSRGKRRNFE